MTDFDTLWNYDDPAATEAAFRQVLPHVSASGDAHAHAELLTQIARAKALISDDMTRPRICHLLESGRVLNSSSQRDKSKPLFQQAYDLALANDLVDVKVAAIDETWSGLKLVVRLKDR